MLALTDTALYTVFFFSKESFHIVIMLRIMLL